MKAPAAMMCMTFMMGSLLSGTYRPIFGLAVDSYPRHLGKMWASLAVVPTRGEGPLARLGVPPIHGQCQWSVTDC